MTAKLVKRMVAVNGAQVQDGWIADIRVRLASGKMYRTRPRVSGTRAAALRWAQEREAFILRNGPSGKEVAQEEEKAPATFAAFAERFLANSSVNNKPSTANAKKHALENHLVPYFGAMRLDEVKAAVVEAFKAQQVATGLANSTINNQLAILGCLLSLAVEWGELVSAPRMRLLKVRETPVVFLDFVEVEAFLAAADPAWHSMLAVAIWTGLRQGELRALQWPDVDLANARLFVRRSLWRGIEGTPKGGREREVGLCKRALEALRAQQLRTALRRRHVFSPDGGARPFSEGEIGDVVRETGAAAGVEKALTWHKLRHTFGAHLAMRNAPPKAIQELMGHQKLAMTERYMHLAPAARQGAVNLLDAPAPSPPPECVAAGGQSPEAPQKQP